LTKQKTGEIRIDLPGKGVGSSFAEAGIFGGGGILRAVFRGRSSEGGLRRTINLNIQHSTFIIHLSSRRARFLLILRLSVPPYNRSERQQREQDWVQPSRQKPRPGRNASSLERLPPDHLSAC
jgi:hypothetical protein